MKAFVIAAIICCCCLCGAGCGSGGGTAGGTAAPVDGLVFNERVTCLQTNAGTTTPFCADQDEMGQVQFTAKPGNVFEVRDVPDSGFVLTGTFNERIFKWKATAAMNASRPRAYTEEGTWDFGPTFASFDGESTYSFTDGFATGSCQTSGAKAPGTPPPTAGPPCP